MKFSIQKIAIVTETYWPEINGVVNTLSHLVAGLKANGVQVQLVRPHIDHKQFDNRRMVEKQVLRNPECPSHSNLRASDNGDSELFVGAVPIPGYANLHFGLPRYFYLKKLWAKQSRPDVVYVATEGPLGLSAVLAANALGIPAVMGFHTNFQSYSQYYSLSWAETFIMGYLRWAHNLAAATLVPTLEQKGVLESSGFERVQVLSRGVDTRLFSPNQRCDQLRSLLGLDRQDRLYLYVGRIAAEKNLQVAIKSFLAGDSNSIDKKAKNQINNKLVIVGDGPLRSELEAAYPQVLFVGSQKGEELARYYASADVFLFPSVTDTFGNVVLEALASGVPVIAFDQAAAKEHVLHGQTGLLVKTEADFRAAIQRTMDCVSMIGRMKSNAINEVSECSWDSVVEHFIELLSSVHKPTNRQCVDRIKTNLTESSKHGCIKKHKVA